MSRKKNSPSSSPSSSPSPLAPVGQRRWTDVAGCAAYLGVAEAWVRRGVYEQSLPHAKMRAHLRFDLDQIDAWIEEHSFGPEAA